MAPDARSAGMPAIQAVAGFVALQIDVRYIQFVMHGSCWGAPGLSIAGALRFWYVETPDVNAKASPNIAADDMFFGILKLQI